MNTEQLMIIINEFVDGELSKEKETLLFTQLGNDEVALEYFKKVNSLKIITNEQTIEFPSQLDIKILSEIKNQQHLPIGALIKSRITNYAAYLLLLITLTAGYFLYNQNIYQEKQLEITSVRLEQQSKILNLLMNNQLAPVTVKPENQNEVVIQATL